MNFKEESPQKIVHFWHRFSAKLMAAQQFDAYHSVCHLFIFQNPKFHCSAMLGVRVINFFQRYPKNDFSRTGRRSGGQAEGLKAMPKGISPTPLS